MDKKMKIIALIALLAYVISPVDLAPGPMDDMIMPTKCWTKSRNPDSKSSRMLLLD